ncbi:NACHT domain-containing protein [Asanoa sp. NPDC049518]|uniref:NACHT domain-containing protein n=1 Tax=unclassified Asanoa TaxID=2685164 RepID=UPI00344945D9
MDRLVAWLDTGDKVASVVGAVAAVVALYLAVRGGRRVRRSRRAVDGPLAELLHAQQADATRHRYRFFGYHAPALSDIYVRPRATVGGTVDSSVADVIGRDAHAVLIGGAGAGKSTLVATVVAELARDAIATGSDSAVAISALDLTGTSLAAAGVSAARRDLNVELPEALFKLPPRRGGRWLVLVDGLDEVIDRDQRSQVLWRLRSILDNKNSHYRLVVTTRPLPGAEMSELERGGAVVYELRPFNRAEFEEFARRWFASRGSPNASLFLARVSGARLGPVARVPLLATIAALVFEQAGGAALPTSRTALYERFVEHLLDGRRELSELRGSLTGALSGRGRLSEAVATWLEADFYGVVNDLLDHLGATQLATVDADLGAAATGWFAAHAPTPLGGLVPDADRLVRDLLVATGLLEVRQGRLRFAHQSFAEFLAARGQADRFDEVGWRAVALNPATRSLAGFAAARRRDADQLVARLLDESGDVVAAGDLVADGVPVGETTWNRVVESLLTQLAADAGVAADCLRVLRELSVDAAVLDRLVGLARDTTVDFWTRAVVADAVADVDRTQGVQLLRLAARDFPPEVSRWAATALDGRGVALDLSARRSLQDSAPRDSGGSLGRIARHVLTERVGDHSLTHDERVQAAIRLCRDGEPGPLRALVDEPGVEYLVRAQAASELAKHGDDSALLRLAAPTPGAEPEYSWGLPRATKLRYAVVCELVDSGHPAAYALLQALADDCANTPMAYGVAARIAGFGDFGRLEELVAGGTPELGAAAAYALVARAGTPSLKRVAESAPTGRVRAVIVAELVRRGERDAIPALRELVRRRGLPPILRVHGHHVLAAGDDPASVRWLRRRARTRGIAAATALLHLDDPLGAETLRAVAGSRLRSARSRVRAATILAAGGIPATLVRLAVGPARGRVRLDASVSMAKHLRDHSALAALVTDERASTTIRRLAVERLVMMASTPSAHEQAALPYEVRVELLRGQSLPARAFGLASVVTTAGAGRVAADPSLPAAVRMGAVAALPDAAAIDVLTAVAGDRSAPTRTRSAAIADLVDRAPDAARPVLRDVVTNLPFGRLATWRLLFHLVAGVLPYTGERPWPEFADIRRRVEKVYDRPWPATPFRLVALLARPPRLVEAPNRETS